ncbi:methionyl-tRNA formyltransferase [Candidatus Berkelbacteria bacterium]|nr:methionyl-tRNA formyltransferase [Candidatus Berkelbacteria bacterium]
MDAVPDDHPTKRLRRFRFPDGQTELLVATDRAQPTRSLPQLPRTVFLGSAKFAQIIFDALLRDGLRPALVITEPPKPSGRGRSVRATPVETWARAADLPIASPATRTELVTILQDAQPELGIVAAYGQILSKVALEIPPYGMVNVHASILPRYRGASPVQAAILDGIEATGVTFMQMDEGVDTGRIIALAPLPLTGTETTPELTEALAHLAGRVITTVLVRYLRNELLLLKQDVVGTHTKKLTKADGEIHHLEQTDPVTLDRKIRALNPWPGVYTDQFGTRLLLRAGWLVDGTYTITRLQWAGKPVADGATFARAYPHVLTALPSTITLGANSHPDLHDDQPN